MILFCSSLRRALVPRTSRRSVRIRFGVRFTLRFGVVALTERNANCAADFYFVYFGLSGSVHCCACGDECNFIAALY